MSAVSIVILKSRLKIATMFLKESEATVLFPGGFGTFDEGFESLTLVQTGKAKPRPIVAIDPPGSSFWRSTLKLFKRNFVDEKLVGPGDLGLIRHFQDTEKAADEITGFYRNYHSSRFFRDQYLVRMRRKLTDDQLGRLRREFKDILAKGSFDRLLDAAQDDIKDSSLHRIVFYFNRAAYDRLRVLIDYLNNL